MILRFRSKFFPVVSPEQLAFDVERARFLDLPALRRLLFRFARFWAGTGGPAGAFSLAGFWPVLGCALGVERRGAFRHNRVYNFLAWLFVHGVTECMALIHPNSNGWLEVSLSTWFVDPDPELIDILFSAATVEPGPQSTQGDVGHIWTARWLICSARSQSDFDAAIRKLEENAGVSLPMPAECSRLMPATVLAGISGQN